MGKKNRHRSETSRFFQWHDWMIRSPAFLSLTPADVRILVELSWRHNGRNNGEIHLSVRDAARVIHGSKSTATRSLARLTELGFIVPTQKGHFDRKGHHATEWLVTVFPTDNEPARRDFMRWSPRPEEKKPGTLAGPLVPLVGPHCPPGGPGGDEKGPEGPSRGPVEGGSP